MWKEREKEKREEKKIRWNKSKGRIEGRRGRRGTKDEGEHYEKRTC